MLKFILFLKYIISYNSDRVVLDTFLFIIVIFLLIKSKLYFHQLYFYIILF